jgi:hypothetical protein
MILFDFLRFDRPKRMSVSLGWRVRKPRMATAARKEKRALSGPLRFVALYRGRSDYCLFF